MSSSSSSVQTALVPPPTTTVFSFDAGNWIKSDLSDNVYIIEHELGEGAFGKTYVCCDRWENKVVLKRIKALHFEPGAVKLRALREIEALAVMRSPFVVPILDQFELNGEFFIVSEYCGRPLSELMNEHDFKPYLWFRSLARCLLQAVQFTKMQGFVHCDIHPGNVFLHFVRDAVLPEEFSASRFMLGDFGLARPVGEVLETTTFLESVRPPEVVDRDEFGVIDHRVDIYQVGLLFLRFLLPDLKPFSQEDILSGKPQDVALTVGAPLFDAIARMLRRHVDFRTGTALQAWEEIQYAFPS